MVALEGGREAASEAHLLAGLVSAKVMDTVCGALREADISAENRERLRRLWAENLRRQGGVPMAAELRAAQPRRGEGEEGGQVQRGVRDKDDSDTGPIPAPAPTPAAAAVATAEVAATAKEAAAAAAAAAASDLDAEARAIRLSSRYMRPCAPYGPHRGSSGRPAAFMALPDVRGEWEGGGWGQAQRQGQGQRQEQGWEATSLGLGPLMAMRQAELLGSRGRGSSRRASRSGKSWK